ncbi:hypothetical protein OQA88_10827 [Cercophora sp. LCS_1]
MEPWKLCTYSVTSLRGGRGMSIITKPDIASNLASVLQDPDIAWLGKERGTPLVPATEESFKVQDIPGKGAGVVATERIAKGQVVMVELPLVIRIGDPSPWNRPGALQVVQQAAKGLVKDDQNRLLQMARQGRGYILDDIFKTNAFHISVEGISHTALYPEIARMNHACVTRYSSRTLTMEIMAYEDVEPGEELTISYLPMNLPYKQRQQLISEWGFACTCSLCRDKKGRAVSDQRRTQVRDILEFLGHPENVTRAKVNSKVAEIEAIAEQEGMTAQLGDMLHLVAERIEAAKNIELAEEIGKKALEAQRYYTGYDSTRAEEVVEFIQRVKRAIE